MRHQPDLDWKIRLLIQLLRLQKPVHLMSLDELRRLDAALLSPVLQQILCGERIELPQVVDQSVEGRYGSIPIRLYYPSLQKNLPLILFFHGGGWIYGNFQTHDLMCRRLTQDAEAIVLAVRYRLSPFFKYPVALEECYDVLMWAVQQAPELGIDLERITVMGDSAGGNLAAALCLLSRDRGQSLIAQQVLIYPVVSGVLDQPAVDRYADGPFLTKEMMAAFVQYYAQDESDIQQAYFSPLLAKDLKHLPPALIITCGYDLLQDQTEAYAQRLKEPENQVVLLKYPNMIHGFLSFPPFCRDALPAFARIAAFVKSINQSHGKLSSR
jgi:acetyl esterase